MADNDVQIKIKLIDQFGHPLDNLQRKIGGFSQAQVKANGYINKSLSDLRAQLARYKEASEKSYRTDHIKKYNELISETKRQISELEKQSESCIEKTGGLGSKFKEVTGISLGWAAVGAAVAKATSSAIEFGKAGIEADAQMQKYNVTLKTMLGSTSAARDRMQEYMDIAKKTPFDLPQVVEAGNKLQALGRYSKENISMLGDLAAASGKPLEQVMTAFSQAATGQKGDAARMFRDLLISQEDWIKATGKGVTKTGELKATTEDMIKALPKIMQAKGFLGMMAAQAETTGGKMANLEDAVFGLKSAIGERLRPATNEFLNVSSKVVGKLNDWVAIPIEQKIASEKNELNSLAEQLITNYDKEEKRRDIIDELNRKYPEFLKNVNLEKDGIEGIKNELIQVNAEYNKKIQRAFYQAKYDKLKEQYDDVWEDYEKYEAGRREVEARKKWNEELRQIAISYGAPDKTPSGMKTSITGGGDEHISLSGHRVHINDMTEDDRERFIALKRQLTASKLEFGSDPTSHFGIFSHKELTSRKKDRAEELKSRMDYLMPFLMGEEEPPPPAIPPTTTPTTPLDLENAANSISSGGKSVKNFNIVINDGLIKQVDNHFASTNESPQSASDFMWQLSQAMQMMLNDMNYAAN